MSRVVSITALKIGCMPMLCENGVNRPMLPAFSCRRRPGPHRWGSRLNAPNVRFLLCLSQAETEPIVPQSVQASRNMALTAETMAVLALQLLRQALPADIESLQTTLRFAASEAAGPLSVLWRILAVLAVGGLLLVVILAVIEPGPLVKRRPFPGRNRTGKHSAQEESRSERDLQGPSPVAKETTQGEDEES